jgi:hypothetical protein
MVRLCEQAEILFFVRVSEGKMAHPKWVIATALA